MYCIEQKNDDKSTLFQVPMRESFHVMFMLALVSCFSLLLADTIYVSTLGSDDSFCGSLEAPCASLSFGVSVAYQNNSNLLLVEPGIYKEVPIELSSTLEIGYATEPTNLPTIYSLTFSSTNGSMHTTLQFNSSKPSFFVQSESKFNSFNIHGFTIEQTEKFLSIFSSGEINSLTISDLQFNNTEQSHTLIKTSALSFNASSITCHFCHALTMFDISSENITISNVAITESIFSTIAKLQRAQTLQLDSWTLYNSTILLHIIDNQSETEKSTLTLSNWKINQITMLSPVSYLFHTNTNIHLISSTMTNSSPFHGVVYTTANISLENVQIDHIHGQLGFQQQGTSLSLYGLEITNSSFVEKTFDVSMACHAISFDRVRIEEVTTPTILTINTNATEFLFQMNNSTFKNLPAIRSMISIITSNKNAHTRTILHGCSFLSLGIESILSPPSVTIISVKQEENGEVEVGTCIFDSGYASSLHIMGGTMNLMDSNFTHTKSSIAADLSAILTLYKTNGTIHSCFFTGNTYPVLLAILSSSVGLINVSMENNGVGNAAIWISNSLVNATDLMVSGMVSKSYNIFISHSNCTFTYLKASNNHVGISGGTIYSTRSFLGLYHSEIEHSTAIKIGGGLGIVGGNIDIQDLLISHCTAGRGGAIWVSFNVEGSINDSQFKNTRAIYFAGGVGIVGAGEIRMNNIVFSSNWAANAGGLFVSGVATPIITNSQFVNCSASSGGGLMTASAARPSLQNCSFSYNVATSRGPAFFGESFSRVMFNDSIFENHSIKQGDGGACYITDECHTVYNHVKFRNNYAGGSGGAIAQYIKSRVNISHSLAFNNSAVTSGGSFVLFNSAYIEIHNITSLGCSSISGGLIAATDFASISLADSVVGENKAISSGGSIYLISHSNLLIENCGFRGDEAESGGSIFSRTVGIMTIYNSTFTNGTAHFGGFMYLSADGSNAPRIFENCHFSGNTASTSGGAIFATNGVHFILSSSFCDYNEAQNGRGGCIYITDEATATITSSTLQGNTANSGGALLITDTSEVNLYDSEIINNKALGSGGAVLMYGNMTSNHCHFIGNHCPASYGGAILTFGEYSFMSLNNCTFIENRAASGGAIFFRKEPNGLLQNHNRGNTTNCTFSGNRAIYGGAICISANLNVPNSNPTVLLSKKDMTLPVMKQNNRYEFNSVLIANNSAVWGGGVYVDQIDDEDPFFTNIILQDNRANFYGGGIHFFTTYRNVTIFSNTTFIDNVGRYGGPSVSFQSLEDPTDAEDFCFECIYPTVYSVESGYQNEDGFATPPNRLIFDPDWDPCPHSVTLDAGAFSLAVFLVDGFSTMVTGQLLLDHITLVNITGTSDDVNDNLVVADSKTNINISPTNGGAFFNDTSLYGANNSSTLVTFTPSVNETGFYSSGVLAPISCSIVLNDCKMGFIVSESDDGDNICVPAPTWSRSELFTFFLLLVICLLCCLILLVLLITSIRYYLRQRKRRKLQAIQIPDYVGMTTLSLIDILNDHTIPQIKNSEVVILQAIGKGASGIVSKGLWKRNGKQEDIALKELIWNNVEQLEIDNQTMTEFLKEIKYMSALHDPHIVSFYGIMVVEEENKLYLVTELMEKGSLRTILTKKSENLPWKLRVKLAVDAAKGMKYLHEKKLIHRDIKSENLLIDKEWTCKIADFGISTVRPTITRKMTCIGTPVYMAPEVLLLNNSSEKADVYSFGIVLWEIFTGELPFDTEEYRNLNQAQLMYHILEQHARPSLIGLGSSMQQLIKDCWNIDPKLRPSFPEIIVRLQRLKAEITREEPLLIQ